jgi:ketosteroid isomerase-like protein
LADVDSHSADCVGAECHSEYRFADCVGAEFRSEYHFAVSGCPVGFDFSFYWTLCDLK